jgi:hypothetical protein
MDDAVAGGHVEGDNVGGGGLGGDLHALGSSHHGDLFAAGRLEGSGALGHVLGLKNNKRR